MNIIEFDLIKKQVENLDSTSSIKTKSQRKKATYSDKSNW
ncbi:hypothetical protein LMANV2_60092 [Leptospira interrogans serovar Manilae]|uniref:Uncharacterized protein n=1 Tax=Leptospira interrogans serovar Manilae TaxID=214675 RepID=A0AAQ1SQ83_LEPIR|nr:hypothetical protein LMANV2_60092 [Leptospira interrogans serovar Manilae]